MDYATIFNHLKQACTERGFEVIPIKKLNEHDSGIAYLTAYGKIKKMTIRETCTDKEKSNILLQFLFLLDMSNDSDDCKYAVTEESLINSGVKDVANYALNAILACTKTA